MEPLKVVKVALGRLDLQERTQDKFMKIIERNTFLGREIIAKTLVGCSELKRLQEYVKFLYKGIRTCDIFELHAALETTPNPLVFNSAVKDALDQLDLSVATGNKLIKNSRR